LQKQRSDHLDVLVARSAWRKILWYRLVGCLRCMDPTRFDCWVGDDHYWFRLRMPMRPAMSLVPLWTSNKMTYGRKIDCPRGVYSPIGVKSLSNVSHRLPYTCPSIFRLGPEAHPALGIGVLPIPDWADQLCFSMPIHVNLLGDPQTWTAPAATCNMGLVMHQHRHQTTKTRSLTCRLVQR
jgi:hypothetical protein